MRCRLLFLLGGLLIPLHGAAQPFPVYDVLYRPPEARYRVLESPHFDVIFQAGLEREARETAAILEAELPATDAFVGSERRLRMPVVLNGFNDRSNGYVTPFPFRQEIEGIGIKGGLLSVRFPSWLWAVGPHELVHAVQAEAGRGFGVGAVVRRFAPDLMRSLNFTMPRGMVEGAAVYRESRIFPGAGRLNDPFFQMQFRAAMQSDRPWSLAQMLEAPAYSRPANRFYIGGSNFFRYLAEQDSARFFRRVVDLHYRFPFLGHGLELWHGTGRSPRRLAQAFREDLRAREEDRLAAPGPPTEPVVLATGPGRIHRRPRWLNDSTLVVYIAGYDVRPGFYRVDARSGRRRLIAHHGITEDLYFSLSPDSSALLFARYVSDALSLVQAHAEVHRLDLATGQAMVLTRRGRALGPVERNGGVWALGNDGPFNQWVRVGRDGSVAPLTAFARALFVQLAPAPAHGPLAVLLNVKGRQGLFTAAFDRNGQPALTPWLLFEDASIYDAAWSADGRYLLFTADLGGIANIFAYDRPADRVFRLTNVAYGARESTLSPDGQTLAYAHYRHERYDLVHVPFRPEEAEEIPRHLVAFGQELPWTEWLNEVVPTPFADAETRPYRALPHLKPRMIYPTFHYEGRGTGPEETALGPGVGLAVQGADPLERWAYGAEVFYQDDRAWGRLVVENGRTFLRPFLVAYDLPETTVALRTDAAGAVVDTLRVGREERGVALGVRLPVILAADVFTTRAGLSLRAAYEQERLFGPAGETLRPFRSRLRLTPSAVFAYRLQANTRDLAPNTGTVVAATASLDAWQEQGGRRRALIGQARHYLPLSLRHHTGLQLQAALITQNRSSVFNLDRLLPRGYEDEFVGRGTFVGLGAEAIQPLWFIDDGFVLLPLYFKALYAYGFAATVFPAEGKLRRLHFSSAGAGVGLQLRFFYLLDFDLRIGITYLLEERRWKATFR